MYKRQVHGAGGIHAGLIAGDGFGVAVLEDDGQVGKGGVLDEMCIRDSNDTVRGFMNKMLHEEIIPTLPLDKKDLEEFASAVRCV